MFPSYLEGIVIVEWKRSQPFAIQSTILHSKDGENEITIKTKTIKSAKILYYLLNEYNYPG